MFTPLFTTGLVLLFVGLFGSRYLAERAMRLLSPEEKLKLLDSFSGLRVFGALPLLPIGFSFFGIGYLPQSFMWPAYFGAWALIALFFLVIHRIVFRKMIELGINAVSGSTTQGTLDVVWKFHSIVYPKYFEFICMSLMPNKSLEPTATPLQGDARLLFRASGSSGCGSALIR